MKNLEKSGDLHTILGKGTIFEGNITVEHSLRVDGRVKGDIKTNETLVIGKDGEVAGNVKVKNLVNAGVLKGTVEAEDKIVLESKSQVHGEMKTSKLVIDEGAFFDGRCSMSGEKVPFLEKKPEFATKEDNSGLSDEE
jgi:cytoskeletal protein CcmA (bactofilin family)